MFAVTGPYFGYIISAGEPNLEGILMYQLVSAIVKPMAGNARWRSMDIGNIPVIDLFSNFKRVLVILSNSFLNHPVSFDIETIRSSHGAYTGSFNQFLNDNDNKALMTSDKLPSVNTRYAKYADALHAGYKVTPIPPLASSTSPATLDEKSWLILTKPELDYGFFYRRCLVNVNGFYHLTDYSRDGVYVVDGMKSCLKSNRNECGIYSFMDLGVLDFIPIRDDMIYKQFPEQELKHNCYVDTDVDLSNKTVMLVLGGYLHVLDTKTFFRVSSTSFGINFSNLPLIDRFYESSKVIDLSSLEMETSTANDEQIGIPDLFSDSVLKKYLTLSQSFFVILDNTDIFIQSEAVKSSPYAGVYSTPSLPHFPLMVGAGRHETPWIRLEYGQYSLQLKSTWQGERNYKTVDQRGLISTDSANLEALGFHNANAALVMIGSDLQMT